jgi:hypothetical protein
MPCFLIASASVCAKCGALAGRPSYAEAFAGRSAVHRHKRAIGRTKRSRTKRLLISSITITPPLVANVLISLVKQRFTWLTASFADVKCPGVAEG